MSLESTKNIKAGAIISYVTIFFSIVSGLLYTPWMVHQIGKSEYGLYALVSSFLVYFMMDFGLGQTIARFLAKYKNEGNEEKVNDLLGLTTRIYLILDSIIFILLVIVYFFIENIFVQLTPVEIEKFKLIFLIAGFFSLLSFPFSSLNGILIAYERFIVLKVADLISKVGTILLMIVALLLGYKLNALIAINALVGLVIILIKLIYLFKSTPVRINIHFKDKELLRQIVKFSVWVTIIGIAQRLLINIIPIILGIFSGTDQITFFSIASVLEGYTWTFASALSGLFLPRVAELIYKNNDKKKVCNLMIKVGRIQLLIVSLLLIGLTTLGKQFIQLWMGPDFTTSYYIMLLLILPGFITLTQEIAATMLFIVNELKYRAIIFIVASLISVCISAALSPKYGAIGSAVGVCTAYILCHIIGMNIVYYKILKLDILRFFKEVHLKLLLPIVLSFLAGVCINYFIPANNLFAFIPKAILLGIVYMIFMWVIGLNAYEKDLIKELTFKAVRIFKK